LRTQLAYLFADALELRTRASISGVLTSRYKHLNGRELRLIIERPSFWEHQLFSEALQREISASASLRRDWAYNLALGSETSVRPKQFVQCFQEKNSEAQRIAGNLQTLFNRALPIAFGPAGQSGDPEGILYVAERVGNIYRSLMEWKLDFFRMSMAEELLQLRKLAASLIDNTITEIEEFVLRLSAELADALNSPQCGSSRQITLTLTLTVADQKPLNEEINRLSELVAIGEIEWD